MYVLLMDPFSYFEWVEHQTMACALELEQDLKYA